MLVNFEDSENNVGGMMFFKNNFDIKRDKDSFCGVEEKFKICIDFGEYFFDGGWGWVVIIVVFFVYVLCNGVYYVFGILFLVI